MTTTRTHLLIIDPQNDFCDLPTQLLPHDPLNAGALMAPGLPVPGAHADMLRLASFIRQAAPVLDNITITLDSHHSVGVERPGLWRHADGTLVAPFTEITAAAVQEGQFVMQSLELTRRALDMLIRLEAGGRYKLMVWPKHCEMGTWGHNIHYAVQGACAEWEQRAMRVTAKVLKGENPWTEHYSAVAAEVPDSADPRTQTNFGLLDSLCDADCLLIAGEAGSHCVKATTEHIVRQLGPSFAKKIVILTDTISAVPGFGPQYTAFLQDMVAQGAQLSTTSATLEDLA